MQYEGSCHCGRIAFAFESGEPVTGALSCNCSLCRRRGSLLWFAPRDTLKLTQPLNDATYRFHKHEIAHHFCPTCGIHTYGEGTAPNGAAMAAINLRCVDQIDLDTLPLQRFDGRAL